MDVLMTFLAAAKTVVVTILCLLGNLFVWEGTLSVVLIAMGVAYERTANKSTARALELAVHYTLVLVTPAVVITGIILFFAGYGIPIGRPY